MTSAISYLKQLTATTVIIADVPWITRGKFKIMMYLNTYIEINRCFHGVFP